MSLQESDPSAGTLEFSLYSSATGAATEQTVSSSGTGAATLSLNNLPAGEYFVSVAPASLSAVTGYQLVFDSPSPSDGGASLAHGNDRSIKSTDLGLIDGTTEIAGNVIQPSSPAWFQFETPRESSVPREIVVQSPFSGTITAVLYNADPSTGAQPVSTTTGTGTLTIPYSSITVGSTTSTSTYWLELTTNNATSATVAGLQMQTVPAPDCGRPSGGHRRERREGRHPFGYLVHRRCSDLLDRDRAGTWHLDCERRQRDVHAGDRVQRPR